MFTCVSWQIPAPRVKPGHKSSAAGTRVEPPFMLVFSQLPAKIFQDLSACFADVQMLEFNQGQYDRSARLREQPLHLDVSRIRNRRHGTPSGSAPRNRSIRTREAMPPR